MASEDNNCEALRTEIIDLQRKFEAMWLKVSSGQLPTPEYRATRRKLDELRAQYGKECGTLVEESTLPRSVTADWRG
jgi:hypothetical protein